jgi:hypothetical protein
VCNLQGLHGPAVSIEGLADLLRVHFCLEQCFSISVHENHLESCLNQPWLALVLGFLNGWIWGGARECAFLLCSQGMLVLLVWGSHSGNYSFG